MNPADVYLQNMVENANPLRLVVMLYDKAISCVDEALEAMETGLSEVENIKRKAENLTKVMDILIVLKASLDEEKGQEIAKNLDEIYSALIDEIVRINMVNDIDGLKKVREALVELRDAWEEAERNVYKKEATVQTDGEKL